jgi:lysophospholipase L1-like esterase
MRTLAICLIALAGTALFPSPATTQDAAAAHEIRFAADIDRFLENDKASPPPRHGILFVGSSIFRLWTTVTEQMAPLPVFNRGFGGSRTWEILAYMDKIVLPYEPDIIVYYCGSNDVNAGEPADAIVARFEQFVRRVAERLPDTRVFFVSIHRSPDKRARWNVVDEANAGIKALAYATPNLDYIEVNPVLFDARDEPRTELYLADGLHFHPPAYVEFTSIIKPVLERAWSERH